MKMQNHYHIQLLPAPRPLPPQPKPNRTRTTVYPGYGRLALALRRAMPAMRARICAATPKP